MLLGSVQAVLLSSLRIFDFEKERFCFRSNYAKPIFFIVFNPFFSSLSVLPFGTQKKSSVNLNAKRGKRRWDREKIDGKQSLDYYLSGFI